TLLRLDVAFFDAGIGRTTDVERTHGELRTRFTDALGSDDTDRHTFFDLRTGRKVHAIALAAHAQRRFASERAADLNTLQAHAFDTPGDLGGDELAFLDDDLVGHWVNDVLAADAAVDRCPQ